MMTGTDKPWSGVLPFNAAPTKRRERETSSAST